MSNFGGSTAARFLSVFSDTFNYQGESKTLTDSCYLIRHDGSYMLWDTGLPAALKGAPFASDITMAPTLAKTLPEQLGEIRMTPDQIETVGISHYHFDHIGQAADFAHARLLIGQGDFDALKKTPTPSVTQPDLLSPWLKDGAKLETVQGDKDIFGDGSVIMLSTPGHTPASYSLLVRLAEKGPVLLSGDTVHFVEQFANNGVPPFNTSRAESLASMDRLSKMAKTLNATLIIQHDPNDIKRLPAFPASAK